MNRLVLGVAVMAALVTIAALAARIGPLGAPRVRAAVGLLAQIVFVATLWAGVGVEASWRWAATFLALALAIYWGVELVRAPRPPAR